jgi:hypothetical protein
MKSIKHQFYRQILSGIRLINKRQYFNTQVKIACILHRFPNGLVMAASPHCKLWNVLWYSCAIGLCNTPYGCHEQAVCLPSCRQIENGRHFFGMVHILRVEPGNVLPNQKRSDRVLTETRIIQTDLIGYHSFGSIISQKRQILPLFN